MTPLFSTPGSVRLTTAIQPGVLCVFDFDGTLSPIVAQPDQARLPPEIRTRLLALQKLTPVAILTGRSLADISSRLDFAADFVIGNHGLEGLPESAQRRAGFEDMCNSWRARLQQAFAAGSDFGPEILMEDKQISLSVHYRHASDQVAVQHQLEQLFATLTPAPRIIAGKFVFNLLPEGAGDKGTAFNQLMLLSGAATAIYVGDDVTDEDVFSLGRPDVLSVRIGQAADSAATFFLPSNEDIARLLDDLIERLAGAVRA